MTATSVRTCPSSSMSRNVALGVDLPIIAAVGGLLVGNVNPLEIEGVSGFASHDVRGHGAGAGGVIELHVRFLSELLIGRTASARAATRVPRAATSPPRRRAWLRIFVERCSLPCD